MIEAKDITVAINGKEIIKDISFAARPGELISILGPSGSGKTTLINTMLGFCPVTKGELHCGQKVLANSSLCLAPGKRGFSAVFQSLNLFPHLNVKANILYGISDLSDQDQAQRLDFYSDLVGLKNQLEQDVNTLSGGEKQRVAIARALVTRPKVLFLDEPFSSLDQKLRLELRRFIKTILKETGVSAFLVTHDKDDAFHFSDRILLLNRGVLQQFAEPAIMYQKPSNDFVESFFSSGIKVGESLVSCVELQASAGGHQYGLSASVRDCYFCDGLYRCHVEFSHGPVLDLDFVKPYEIGVNITF